MSSFKNKWHSMSSRKKQVLIVGGLITTVVLGAVMFGESGTSTFNHDNDDDDTSVNVFSTNRAREAGIDGLSSQVRSLAAKNRQLEDKLAGIQATNKRFNEALQNSDSEAAIGVALSDIRDEIVGFKRENKDLKSQLNIIDDEPFGLPLSRGDSGGEEYQEDEYQEVTSGGIPVAKAPPDASQTTGEDEAQEKAKEKRTLRHGHRTRKKNRRLTITPLLPTLWQKVHLPLLETLLNLRALLAHATTSLVVQAEEAKFLLSRSMLLL